METRKIEGGNVINVSEAGWLIATQVYCQFFGKGSFAVGACLCVARSTTGDTVGASPTFKDILTPG